MKKVEVQLGDVTYLVSRKFCGSKTVSDLLIDHVAARSTADSAVDAVKKPAV